MRWLLAASMLLFVLAGSRLAFELPVWHEIVSALPANASRVPGEAGCLDGKSLILSAVRPHWSLCVHGQSLPIMVTPYASGIATWPLALLHPLHRGNLFALRAIWLVIAALSLLLTYRLIARLHDRSTAGLACFMVAASAPFLVINSLLLPFETLPCTLMVAALSLWVTIADPEPRSSHLYAGALLAGLSVAANVKALFLLVPVVAVAWRSGVRPRGIGRARAAAMALLFVVPLLPMLVFSFIDPQRGLLEQITRRSGYLVENLTLSRLHSESLLLFNFAADTGSILDLAQGARVHLSVLHIVYALPILYCVIVGAARLLGRSWGSPLAAATGAIVLALFFASLLLYRQYPGGNYAPLHDVLGLAVAAGVIDLSRRRWLAAPVIVLLAALSVTTTLRHDFRRSVAFSINAQALAVAADHLEKNPDPPNVITTTYNLTGVVAALADGRVSETRAYRLLADCERSSDLDACMDASWRKLLAHPPVRVLVPASTAPIDKPVAITERLIPSLVRAGAILEQQFATADGLPVLALYRVTR